MYGHGVNNFAGAARLFSGGDLSVGQTFSFVLAVNFRNGNKGFDLLDSSGGHIWNFNVGDPTGYTVNGSQAFSGSYDANTAFSFQFVQNPTTLSWTVARSG